MCVLIPALLIPADFGRPDSFRAIYVAKFADAVYVLHAFQKKTQKTAKTDIDLAASRYRKLVAALQ